MAGTIIKRLAVYEDAHEQIEAKIKQLDLANRTKLGIHAKQELE